MAHISLDSAIRIHEDVVFRELDGEAVILQLQSGVYFGLDPVGTRLWQMLEVHGNLRRTAEEAMKEFDTTQEVIERDLLSLAAELEARQLVTIE